MNSMSYMNFSCHIPNEHFGFFFGSSNECITHHIRYMKFIQQLSYYNYSLKYLLKNIFLQDLTQTSV